MADSSASSSGSYSDQRTAELTAARAKIARLEKGLKNIESLYESLYESQGAFPNVTDLNTFYISVGHKMDEALDQDETIDEAHESDNEPSDFEPSDSQMERLLGN